MTSLIFGRIHRSLCSLPLTLIASKLNFGTSAALLSRITSINSRDHWVVGADEGRTIVCYHPERPFPYEHSLPIPREESLLKEEDSVLNLDVRHAALEAEALRNKKPLRKQLAAKLFAPEKRFVYTGRKYRKHRIHKLFPRDNYERDGL